MRTHCSPDTKHQSPVTNLHTPGKQNNGGEKEKIPQGPPMPTDEEKLFQERIEKYKSFAAMISKEGRAIPVDDYRIRDIVNLGVTEAEVAEAIATAKDTLEPEPILTPVKGEVHVPAFMPTTETETAPQAHDLRELLPTPLAITVDTLPQAEIQTETATELIKRALNPRSADSSPDTEDSINPETSSNIKSKRGCERLQKIINEKRDLEKQVEDLQVTVTSLQDVIRKYEVESKLVGNVMTLADAKKKPSALVSDAKLQMLNFLNTRSDEVDHIDKAICFNKYMSDPFYMQVFVQNNQPEQWQTMIESIYEAIERPEPSFANAKHSVVRSLQPIRARTSTLGAPLASSENPMDRIAQHLGNMGI
jgi:hypothetical protein